LPKYKAKNTPKTKEANAVKHKPKKRLRVDIEIEEKIAACGRRELAEIVYIGELVERVLKGEFGSVLRALLKGRSAMELAESRIKSDINPDRYLGRLDAYERILEDLEQYVIDKDNASSKIIKDSEKNTSEIQTAPEVGEGFLSDN
jgi:hypothetical protein